MSFTIGSIKSKYMRDMPVVGAVAPSLYSFAQPPISAIQTYNKFTGQLGPRINTANIVPNFINQFNQNIAKQNGMTLQSPTIQNANLPVTTQTYSNGKINIAMAGTEKDVLEAINILNAHYSKP